MLYLLPGMGASKEMYQGAWLNLPETSFIDWPDYRGEATLAEVAKRIIEAYKITPSDCIGGSSLGGMVALEIFKNLGNPKVVLLGSALNAQEIRPLLKTLAPLASLSPITLIQTLTKSCTTHLVQMFNSSDPRFIKAMCLAVSQWEGFSGDKKKIVRIHGELDLVIPCPQDKDTNVIKGAGHLIAMTHPNECMDVIQNTLI